jgi:hypothetical protein
MVRCRQCGHSFRPISGFCPNCLTRLRRPLAPRVLFGIAGLCALAVTLAVDAAVLAKSAEATRASSAPASQTGAPAASQPTASGPPASGASPTSPPQAAQASPSTRQQADTPGVPLVPPGVVALGNMPDTSTERAPVARRDQKRVGLARSLN